MRGDYVRLEVGREAVQDGMGGEGIGVVVRVWVEASTWADDREELLALEMRLPEHEPPIALPPVGEAIEHVLSTMEVPVG